MSVINKMIAQIAGGLCLLGFPCSVHGQETQRPNINPVVESIESSFSLPLRDWFKRRNDEKKEHPLRGFSVGPSFNYPLFKTAVPGTQGVGNQGQQAPATSTVTVSVKYNPITYWFAQTTFYAYLEPRKQQAWNPDFSYSFGYDDWHPYTFSLVYSNYGGNRFHPQPSQQFTVFPQGTFSLGWKFQLPAFIENQLKLTESGSMGWSVAYNVAPRYVDAKTLKMLGPKQVPSLSYRNQFYKNYYWNITFYGYPKLSQEQPWNPDFTYGFGYFDYRPGKFSIEYNNYSGNRFPWRKSSPGTGTLKNGTISLMWNWAWAQ